MATGTWAHLSSGVVDNVILLDPDDCGGYPLAGLVQVDGITPQPGIGWTYNGSVWAPPAPEAPITPGT